MNPSVTEKTSHAPESSAPRPVSLRELAANSAGRHATVRRVLDRAASEGYVPVAAFHSSI